jgi:hypothetical protein
MIMHEGEEDAVVTCEMVVRIRKTSSPVCISRQGELGGASAKPYGPAQQYGTWQKHSWEGE